MLMKVRLKIMILKTNKMLIFIMILKMSLNMKHKSIFEESTSDEIDAANVVSDKDETRKKVRKKNAS